MTEPSELLIRPELYLRDGNIIRTYADAIGYARAHEARPGVDARDEVLHGLERAETAAERRAAADAFLAWLEALDLLLAAPEAAKRQ